MNKAVIYCCLAITTFSMLSIGALAADDKPKKTPDLSAVFKRKDKNGDNALSKEEFLAGAKDDRKDAMEKRFSKSDKNGDGKLSMEEFEAGMAGPKKKK